ncbi:hypothetical protein NL676_005220 [Syzygium grande]|nr:hypothetical protein NL676_005220 [Syzygium grande]
MLLVSSILLLSSSSHGLGRKVMETVKQESGGQWRKMAEVMDYADPEPNTNPRTGYLLSPPPPPPPPPPGHG